MATQTTLPSWCALGAVRNLPFEVVMICDVCAGAGMVLCHPPEVPFSKCLASIKPCEECGGTGRTHCCRGDQPCAQDTTDFASGSNK